MSDDGRCPACGRPVDGTTPGSDGRTGAPVASPVGDVTDESAPWHFKLLVVAVVGYLGWRLIEIFV